jgi:hypothetical protein
VWEPEQLSSCRIRSHAEQTRDSIPSSSKRFFSSSQHSDKFLAPSHQSPTPCVLGDHSLELKCQECEADHLPPSSADFKYVGELVNMSQMDIYGTHVIVEPVKTFISQHTLRQHWYICPIALPVRRNPQHRSFLTVVSSPGRASSATFKCRPSCELLYATNSSHHNQETFLYEYPLYWVLLPQKPHKRMLLFGSTLLKHCHHYDY